MRTSFTNRLANLLIGCFFLLFSQNIFGQCATADPSTGCASCTNTIVSGATYNPGNEGKTFCYTGNGSLAAGLTLNVQPMTWKGSNWLSDSTPRVGMT